MSIISSPEMFINMKSIPTKNSRDYDAFVLNELDKLEYGLTINGVHISNWLYWHINYWKFYQPQRDERSGLVKDKFLIPQLRDNEWLVAEHLELAKKGLPDRIGPCGLMIVGARRIAKTTIVASWLGLHGTIFEGSQNVIVGNNKGDISNITTQMDKGLSDIEPFLRYDRLFDDWRKEVSLGWKEKKVNGKRLDWSHFYIKNTEDGKATEILAGLTPSSLVYDEIGKAPIKEAFLAGMPAFGTEYGWRCIPLLTGTGGDFTKGKDAEEMFHNPERFNLLAINIPNEERKTSLFVSGVYSIDHNVPKIEMPLSTYLKVDKGSELDIIPIKVSNETEALKVINQKRDSFLKAKDQKEYLKAVMYLPLNADECFMSDMDENPFPVESLKKHLDFLNRRGFADHRNVKLYREPSTGKVAWTEVNLKPVSEFPVTRDTIKDAPVVIIEPPMENTPALLYVSGADPYNKDKSTTSPSLGSVYIYKRVYDPVAGTFQNRIVAYFVARPETMKIWHQTVEMLLELYNATCMIEFSDTNFTQYMDNKNKGHMLADGYNLAKEITPKTSVSANIKGLPATKSVQNHYRNLIIEYLEEELLVDFNKETGEEIKILGLTRIEDPMLLIEMINYKPPKPNEKGGNYDRIVAFGHCLVYDSFLQKVAPTVKIIKEENEERAKPNIKSPFILNKIESGLKMSMNPFL